MKESYQEKKNNIIPKYFSPAYHKQHLPENHGSQT